MGEAGLSCCTQHRLVTVSYSCQRCSMLPDLIRILLMQAAAGSTEAAATAAALVAITNDVAGCSFFFSSFRVSCFFFFFFVLYVLLFYLLLPSSSLSHVARRSCLTWSHGMPTPDVSREKSSLLSSTGMAWKSLRSELAILERKKGERKECREPLQQLSSRLMGDSSGTHAIPAVPKAAEWKRAPARTC
mmetsp:Transcript_52203/g.111135  ORF Transcript_52203/g.111135 Transcript_52203/m.111135 type:complete len:189 (+) Transcript_52203:743-1309(+)